MKLVSIQYARALAALAVVLYHATARGDTWFQVGSAGVDVFFVISGFIMWTVTERETKAEAFLAHRLVRIAPLYWIATLVAAASIRPDLVWLVASALFIPWRAPDGAISPVLVQGWTLQYEMFFYLLFAIGLVLSRRLQLALVTTALLGLSCIGLAAPSQHPVVHTYTDPLLLEFLAGIWLAVIWRGASLPRWVGPPLLTAAVLWFAVIGVARLDPSGWARLFYWGVPASMLATGFLALEDRMPASRLGLALGDGSYSIYLFHGFISTVVWRLPLGPMRIPVAVIASAVGGWMIFRLIEAPMTRFLRERTAGVPRRRAVPEATPRLFHGTR
jgi:exopolysaccharide production protein ExoZ